MVPSIDWEGSHFHFLQVGEKTQHLIQTDGGRRPGADSKAPAQRLF